MQEVEGISHMINKLEKIKCGYFECHRRKPTADYASFFTLSPMGRLVQISRFHEYSSDRIIQSD